MSKYLTYQYWFGQPVSPNIIGHADQAAFIVGLLLAAVGFGLMYYKTTQKDKAKKLLIEKIYTLLLTIGILAVVWFGLRFELIQVFSTRIVVVLIYIIGLVWAYYVWRYYKFVYVQNKHLSEKERLKNKYL